MDIDKSLVLVDRSHPHCTILTLNRPDKRNALTIDLMESLCNAIEATQNLPEQRAIILKGAGQVFCAGLDLSEAADMSREEHSSKSLGKILKTIYDCPLITIASVHGAALAGGAGIMCACDLVIAESGTIFGFPEIRRGLVPAQIMPFMMRLLPRRMLYELVLLGESIDVHRAFEIGLINKIAKTYGAFPEALKFVEFINKGGPEATARAKTLMQKFEPIDFNEGLKAGLELHRELRHSDESKEGIQAFLEKRSPRWSK